MDNFELFQRMALAVAIGAMIGVERHWRERDVDRGQRTAGLRTFALIGLLGGAGALIERDLAGAAVPAGVVLATFFAVLAGAVTLFEYRQSVAEGSFSVTTVVAAMLTFALGALAVVGNMEVASAGAVVLVSILFSREALHAFMRRLSWAELRSAVVLLALTLVLLPVIPSEPIGPYGGISPSRTLTLVIVLAAISFSGYIAVKLLGPTRGELVAGAVGGLVSSTAVTLTNARRSKEEEGAVRALAAGAIGAGAISFLRTGVLAATLSRALAPLLLPALIAGAVVLIGFAAFLARSGRSEHAKVEQKNPFELGAVIKMALLLVVVAFVAKAASETFGSGGLLVVSALSGLADVDAATVAVTGMRQLAPTLAASAIALALFSNVVAKAVYGTVLGARTYWIWLWLASVAAATAAGAALFFTMA